MIPSESGKKDILFFGVTKEYMSFLFCINVDLYKRLFWRSEKTLNFFEKERL